MCLLILLILRWQRLANTEYRQETHSNNTKSKTIVLAAANRVSVLFLLRTRMFDAVILSYRTSTSDTNLTSPAWAYLVPWYQVLFKAHGNSRSRSRDAFDAAQLHLC